MPPSKPPISLGAWAALITTGLSGVMVAGLKPMLVTLYITRFGYSTQVTGNILTAEMLAATTGAALVSLLVRRCAHRRMARLALALLLISDLASMVPLGLWWLAVVRGLAGAAEGMAVATMAATITGLPEPERLMGTYNTLSMLVFAAAFAVAPALAAAGGMKAVFLSLALMTCLPLVLSNRFPSLDVPAGSLGAADASLPPIGRTVCLLLATAAFYIAWGGLWPFLGEMGRHAGLTTSQVGGVLSVSQLVGAAASILTAALGRRLGRILPIVVAVTLAFACTLSLLVSGIAISVFEWAVPLFMGCAMLFLGYLMGVVATVDRIGRVTGWVFAIQTIGLGIGPAWGAALVVRHGYRGILTIVVACIPLTLVFLVPVFAGNAEFRRGPLRGTARAP